MNITKEYASPKIGEVYLVGLYGSDHEQTGNRPCVVFQNNVGNRFSPNVIIIPLTSKLKKTNQPTHVFLEAAKTGLALDSMALCENPMCVSKLKLGRYITRLSDYYMKKIAIANILATSSISFIDNRDLEEIRNAAVALNSYSATRGDYV